jgi:hypothetical protein
MKRRCKVLSLVAILLVVAGSSLALVLSHNSACPAAPRLAAGAPPMKAIVYRCYGSPEVLKLEEIAKPSVADDRMIVKVHAASVNPLDWHYMRGEPYFMRAMAEWGSPKAFTWGLISQARWSRLERMSRGSSPAMKCSAAAMAPSGST